MRFDDRIPSIDTIARMNQVLYLRGTDGCGIFQMRHIAVGNRRLKILDLSEHAQQPIVDSQLGLGILFNGCIYKFRELRSALASFPTQCG